MSPAKDHDRDDEVKRLLAALERASAAYDADPTSQHLDELIAIEEQLWRIGDHPLFDRAAHVHYLAAHLGDRYRRVGNLADITRAIELAEEALRLAASGPSRAGCLGNLANHLSDRYERVGNLADITRAIELVEEALRLAASGPRRTTYLNNLANHLSDRYERVGNLADITRAIELVEEALRLAASGPSRAMYLNNLANHLALRYKSVGNPVDLDRSVALAEEAVALTPSGPDRAMYLNNLANHLALRYDRTSDLADLARMIALAEEAVALTASGPDRAMYLNSLASHLARRYERDGNPVDLDRAIELAEEALRLTASGPRRTTYLNNLATYLSDRYERDGNPVDLDRAIELAEEALRLTASGPRRAAYLYTFAGCFAGRYKRDDDLADLARAIELAEEALRLTASGPSRADRLNVVAIYVSDRYDRDYRPADLARAIELAEEAVALTPFGPRRAMYLNNLAIYVFNRYERTGDLADLARAIALGEEAVALTASGPSRAGYLNNLANHLDARYRHRGNPADLARAVVLWREVLEMTASTNPRPAFLAARSLSRYFSAHPKEAAFGADRGLLLVEHLVATFGDEAGSWLWLVQGIAQSGAFAHVLLALSSTDEEEQNAHLRTAVLLLERGQGMLVSARRLVAELDAAREVVGESLVAAFLEASAQLRQLVLVGSPGTGAQALSAAERAVVRGGKVAFAFAAERRAREDLVEALRRPLFPPASFEVVANLAHKAGAPVVYLVATESRGFALVVSGAEITFEILDGLTTGVVAIWTERLESLSGDRGISVRGVTDPTRAPCLVKEARDAVSEVLSGLATALAPLDSFEGALCLVPTGTLARLPIPAVLATQTSSPRPVSVAASGRLHHQAYDNASSTRAERPAGVLAAPAPCTTAPPSKALTGARYEAELVAEKLRVVPLVGAKATKAALLELLRGVFVLHLATHGIADPLDPPRSAVLLCDGADGRAERFELAEVPSGSLMPRLIFLAACWLGQSGARLPDEAVGFPMHLVAEGAGGVVAPLWPIPDEACALFVAHFYSYLVSNYSPAAALAAVQVEHSNEPELAAAFFLAGA